MPSFGSLFRESKGRPVVYNGQRIQLADRLHLSDGQTLKVKIESTNSEWRQGIRVDIDKHFEVNGHDIKKGILLWQDTAPPEVYLTVRTKNGECWVRNIWDVGNGAADYWHNGAAMIVEEYPGGRRYRCNDGHPDEDFDDIIFSIDILDE